MSEAHTAKVIPIAIKERLIVSLDVETESEARDIISEIGNEAGAFKIGLQLFTLAGSKFVSEVVRTGTRVFLDLKFHDIPNTVAKAGVEAARLGVWMFNVHAMGGSSMMRQAVNETAEVCEREGLAKPKIIAVTVLTSSDSETLRETGIETEVEKQVLHLAELTAECGLDGVVASGNEIVPLRRQMEGRNFLIVTPGIRPAYATKDDQRRVMTPGAAIADGSDYLVIGRPIIKSRDRRLALEKILGEMETASNK